MDSKWKKTCNVPAFLTIFIPTTTLVMILVLVILCIRCNGGMVFDDEVKGNILCPAGSDNGVMVMRMCVSIVIMTLVSGIMTLCAWHLWVKKRRQMELQEKMERGLLVGEDGKAHVPPEIPPVKKILLPKDMPEHLCLAA